MTRLLRMLLGRLLGRRLLALRVLLLLMLHRLRLRGRCCAAVVSDRRRLFVQIYHGISHQAGSYGRGV